MSYHKIESIANPLYIRGIGTVIYFLKDFIHVPFYLPIISNSGKLVLAEIKKEIYLVKRLRAKILVDNDILISESFVLDLLNKKATIFSCDTKIQILIKS